MGNQCLKSLWIAVALVAMLVTISLQLRSIASEKQDAAEAQAEGACLPTSMEEARGRARLLHETIHGTLQVVHRDFFDEDDAHAIPSASLEDVFHELSKGHHVQLRWLNVNTDVVNVDHTPQDEFEQQAVRALAAGKNEFESLEEGRFRYAGRIRLASQCLKCHVKHRTSTEDRAAGLLISMPVNSTRRSP